MSSPTSRPNPSPANSSSAAVPGRAECLSIATSLVVKGLQLQSCLVTESAIGPIRTRRSRSTGCPIARHILRTWRERPSWMVISRVAGTASSSFRAPRSPYRRRGGFAAIDHDAARQPAQVRLIGHSPYLRLIDSIDLMTGMHQPRGQLAVVGEQQEPFRVVVESSDRIDVLARTRNQIEDGRAALRIEAGRDKAPRLVQQQIDAARRTDSAAIHANVVGFRVGPAAQLPNDRPVDRHAPIHDQSLGRPTRRDTRGGEDFLQTLGSVLGHADSRGSPPGPARI